MARVLFTQNLQRHVSVPPCEVEGADVRGVMEAVFRLTPRLRGYIVDDQGALRKHMAIFVNGEQILDREHLSDPVPAGAEVFVVQALSGG